MVSAVPSSAKRRVMTPAKSRGPRHAEDSDDDTVQRRQAVDQRRSALNAIAATTPRKQFMSANFAHKPANLSLSPSREQTGESAAQLKDLYTKTIGLCNNNKINSQNAWTLQLIDYMDQLIEGAVDGETNFQRASFVMDAGTKIYSARVDDVHTHAYRILTGLNRADAGGAEGTQDDEDGEEKKGPTEGRKRARKVYAGKTIEKKLSNIDINNFETAPEANQLLRQTSGKNGDPGAGSLLLYRLPVVTGCQLAFDGMAVINPPEEGEGIQALQRAPLDISAYRAELPTAVCLTNPSLCRAIETHSFGKATEVSLASWQAPESTSTYDESLWDAAASAKATDWCVQENSFDQGAEDDEGIFEPNTATHATQTRDMVAVVASSKAGQYSYLPALRAAEWAGPMHWRPRPAVRTGGAGSKEGPRSKKAKYRLDFTEQVDVDWAQELAVGKSGLTLAKATMEQQGEAKTTLPEDRHYHVGQLACLLTRPDLTIGRQQVAVDEDRVLGGDTGHYDYDNARDADYVAPDPDGQLEHDEDDDDAAYEPAFAPSQVQGEEEDMAADLVAAPRLVGQTKINFARLAKKVDVQVLKQGLWDRLGLDTPQGASKEEATVSFQHAVVDLPSRLGAMGSNLSVPLMFVCLLHLANERGLHIASTPQLNDLLVKSDPIQPATY
eukprot:comp23917_c0_seq1/m.42179 comp23917_c0_seq1/g.42179  ORF comp23917_c0_seq1/g.42179 comp23917_c0_seq1/m.42179 type:complete len:669 (-) comp23917_c0_seq1:255-2261(-)